jgi:hypothetical protein
MSRTPVIAQTLTKNEKVPRSPLAGASLLPRRRAHEPPTHEQEAERASLFSGKQSYPATGGLMLGF